MAIEHKSKTWNRFRGYTCGVMLWSERPLIACEFVQFIFFPVLLVETCFCVCVVCMFCSL